MDGFVPVIGKSLHGIEQDPEYDKYGKAQDKATGSTRQIKEAVE
jgi:hypothetical protein